MAMDRHYRKFTLIIHADAAPDTSSLFFSGAKLELDFISKDLLGQLFCAGVNESEGGETGVEKLKLLSLTTRSSCVDRMMRYHCQRT
jgi:hypothetical protein